MKFLKYHGAGNDFIIPDEPVAEEQLSSLARTLCHRQFGFGADGLLYALPSDQAAIRMAYYNQDGTPAPMCGNGLRCFARYVHETGRITEGVFSVETLAGLLLVDVTRGYDRIRVEIGTPRFTLAPPETARPLEEAENLTLSVNGRSYDMTVLFLGTLHGVIFTEGEVPEEDAHALCHHPFFPGRINVNFVRVPSRDHLEVTTYERGVGYTLACGTGVCAAQVAAHRNHLTENQALVTVPGGTLSVQVEEKVFLTGPAVRIGKGEMENE